MSKRGKEKSKPSRMTPELLAELIAVHSQCVHDQRGRCALTVFVRPLCWEINQAMGVGDDEDKGFRRVDETVDTTIQPDGKVKTKRYISDEETLREMEFQEACEEFVIAERKWAKIDARATPRWAHAGSDPKNLCDWFDALERRFKAEKKLWLLFVGKDRSVRSNRVYLNFRRAILAGGRTRADA